jgi:hypothetical protein
MNSESKLPALLQHSLKLYPKIYRERWGPELQQVLLDDYNGRINDGASPGAVRAILFLDVLYNALLQHNERRTEMKSKTPKHLKNKLGDNTALGVAGVLYAVSLVSIYMLESQGWAITSLMLDEILTKALMGFALLMASFFASLPLLRYFAVGVKERAKYKKPMMLSAAFLAVCLVTMCNNWAFVPFALVAILFIVAAVALQRRPRYSLALIASAVLNVALLAVVGFAATSLLVPTKTPFNVSVSDLTLTRCFEWVVEREEFYSKDSNTYTIPQESIPKGCRASLATVEAIYTSKRGTAKDPLSSGDISKIDITPSTVPELR